MQKKRDKTSVSEYFFPNIQKQGSPLILGEILI